MPEAKTPKLRGRRGSELILILMALAVGMFAYANIGWAIEGTLPGHFFLFSILMGIIALVMHIVVRKTAQFADPLLVPLVLFLNCLGIAMIYRIDLAKATSLATKQIMWTALGVVAACVILIVIRDHRTVRRYSYVSMIGALVLALLPLVPGLGKTVYGARIWIEVGPFSFQPAELSKIFLAIFFAAYLVDNRDRLAIGGPKFAGLHLPRMRDFGPIILVWIASLGILVSQRDLGTSLLFFGLFVAMLYVATERISWIIIGGLLFAAGAALAVSQFSHVQNRFTGWLNAMDPEIYNAIGGSGQLVRGLFGMASGGLFGTGWGQGNPSSVPFSYSDFIIPSLGEELGLVGLFAIFSAYMLFVQRGFRIALSTRDGFGKLLAGGLAFVVAWQCFVVIGGVTRLIPLTGLTTPFLAYGGSSLLANWIIVAILLRISDNARRPVPLPLRGALEISDIDDDSPSFIEPETSGSPLGRRVPGESVQHLGEVGGASAQGTGPVSRRSTRSFANSQERLGTLDDQGFAAADAQATQIHQLNSGAAQAVPPMPPVPLPQDGEDNQ